MIRVQIIESNHIFLIGLHDIFSGGGFEVTKSSTDANVSGVPTWNCDVILLDPSAITSSTVEAFLHKAAPIAPVELILDEEADMHVSGYSRLGVPGYILRTASVNTIRESTRDVVCGGNALGTRVTTSPRMSKDEFPLSQRERQVLRHIARGLTNVQIARLLGISHFTVDTYLKRIRSKLGLGNRAELTRAAMMAGIFND